MMKYIANLSPTTKKYAADVALLVASQVAFYYAFKYVMAAADPARKKRKEAKDKSKGVLTRLGFLDVQLSEYEQIIATELVHADELSVKFNQIGGLDPIIQSLRESVILPLRHPKLFTSSSGLLGAPKGVLLYGPPGCGKTMLAKALAKESGATFINLHVSTLTDKWFGESNKLVSALFSLAKRLQPSIIFIDEIDSFLRERRSTDHEVTGMMKAEFMSLWDGLTTGEDTRIIILGATNRPNDIDSAILRRMPKRFRISTPNDDQRKNILKLMLKDIRLHPQFDFASLITRTEGFSGSDLKELCRNAAMIPVREYVRANVQDLEGIDDVEMQDFDVRALQLADFFDHPDGEYDETSAGEVKQEPQD